MKKRLSIAGAVLLIAGAGIASAEGDFLAESNFSASFALTTDYVFRGISNTNENWAIQGSADYAHPLGFYLGVWASNTDVGNGNIEMDYYGGFGSSFRGISYDLSGIYYAYPKSKIKGNNPDPNFFEVHVGLSYTFPLGSVDTTVGAGYNYSPNFTGEDGDANYVNGTVGFALPYGFNLDGELGYQDVQGDKSFGARAGENGNDGYDYWHWKIGVSRDVKGFGLDLSYHDTDDEHFFGHIADKRVVFTLSRTI